MAEASATPSPPKRDWWVILGMSVTAIAAAASSFSGLCELARAAGWADTFAPLLPLTVDAYAMTATRVWLVGSSRHPARRFARWNAIGAVVLSVLGNATWHLIAEKEVSVSWPIIVLVGAVPPTVLGLLTHLAVLRTLPEPEPGTVPAEFKAEGDRPQYGTEDELLAAARVADAAHQAQHGRPITRDALRRELRIGGQRATDLLRELRQQRDVVNSTDDELSTICDDKFVNKGNK